MSRIIRTPTPGKDRGTLSKAIVITIREFIRLQEPDESTNDMIAFIILALEEIFDGIEKSVVAWEKRGYWVKADKYRMDWQWTGPMASQLDTAFLASDWSNIAGLLMQLMEHFSDIKVSDKHRMGQPWENAYMEYQTGHRKA